MARNSRKQSIRQERRTANRALKRGEVIDFQGRAPWQAERDRAVQDEVDTRYANSKKSVDLQPQSKNQSKLLDLLNDEERAYVFATGPAGTGKTYVSTLWAIKQLKAGAVKKIIITRPNVAVDGMELGFLPGTVTEKMAPWVAPFLDYFGEYYTKTQIEGMIEAGVIEIVPTEYLRGRTFKNCIVLADETQNLSISAMKSLLTRIGDGSRMVLAGDVEQSDVGKENGLADFMGRLKANQYIGVVEFSVNDVKRHPAIAPILRMYGG